MLYMLCSRKLNWTHKGSFCSLQITYVYYLRWRGRAVRICSEWIGMTKNEKSKIQLDSRICTDSFRDYHRDCGEQGSPAVGCQPTAKHKRNYLGTVR